MEGRRAFVDESYGVAAGHYLLAAVVLDEGAADRVRDRVSAIRRRHPAEYHWRDEHRFARRAMVGLVASLGLRCFVVVASSVPPARQERARALCTAALLSELEALDPPVTDLVVESRTAALDSADARRIAGLRISRHLGLDLHCPFRTKAEPLLWLADAVAGAASADLAGVPDYLRRQSAVAVRRDVSVMFSA